MEQTAAEAAFAAFVQLSSEDKREFRAMMTGYEFRASTQSEAGRKSAETKRAAKSKTATAAGES